MILKQTIKKVEEDKTFKSFIKDNPDYYLAHCFIMLELKDKFDSKWELGYYSKKKDNIVTFETDPIIQMRAAEDAFKKSGVVKPLDIKKVKFGVKKAIEICEQLVESKYRGQTVTKYITILQNLEKEVYNITMVTISFNIINVHIDAATGEVLKSNIQSILSLRKE